MRYHVIGVALFLAIAVFGVDLISGAPKLDGEIHEQVDRASQTDQELVLETMKQHHHHHQQQQEQAGGKSPVKGADVATRAHAIDQNQQQLVRVQRSLNQASLFASQQLAANQQQPYEDEERLLRRQLPDLLAQAHTDKTLERALLRMLINASLRTSMNGVGARTSSLQGFGGPVYYNNVASNNPSATAAAATSGGGLTQDSSTDINWQEVKSADGFARNGFNGLSSAVIPQMSSRLGRLIDDYAGAEPISVEWGQSLPLQEQFQAVVDKREYLKPCSFNAVSCAKNPFKSRY